MTSRWTGRRSDRATRAGPAPFRWRMLGALAALLTVFTVAQPDAAEISADNSLSSGAGAASVALHHITVTIYKSRTVSVEKPFTKAIVGSNEIVDVLPISDRTLYLQGKKLGTTNVTVFDSEGRLVSILDVEVAIDIGEIQQKIQRSIGLDVVRVSATGNQVTLTGLVPDTVVADRAISVAKGLAGDAVVNAMQIAPSQQVMLEVRWGGILASICSLPMAARRAASTPVRREPRARSRKPVRGPAACRFSRRSIRW
jgi:pilus assembly protein CpaC